jgi:uncharacterized GH25 family protein
MRRSHARRRAAVVTAPALALLASASVLAAHDFWIIPDAFQIAAGGTLEVRGQTGTRFPTSVSAVRPDRVAEARLLGASSDERLTDLSTSGRSLLIRHRPTTEGQYIVAVALAPRSSRTTPERLQRYIALEGAPELAQRYNREGAYPKSDSVTQVAAKFAKTIVQVGSGGRRAFARPVGHALELVPVTDPARRRIGDTLAVRLLHHGQPVAGAHLHAGAAPVGVTAATEVTPPMEGKAANPGDGERKDISVVTGVDGIAHVPLAEAGLWNVRTLHAAPAPGGVADQWEVYFATIVFNVAGGRRGATRRE